MYNLTSLSVFIFIFCILITLKYISGFLSALFSDPPKKFDVTNKEQLLIGGSLSYILTFIISLFI
jgi:hypothetical protein